MWFEKSLLAASTYRLCRKAGCTPQTALNDGLDAGIPTASIPPRSSRRRSAVPPNFVILSGGWSPESKDLRFVSGRAALICARRFPHRRDRRLSESPRHCGPRRSPLCPTHPSPLRSREHVEGFPGFIQYIPGGGLPRGCLVGSETRTNSRPGISPTLLFMRASKAAQSKPTDPS